MLIRDTVPVDFKGLSLCICVLLCHPHIQMEILQETCGKLQISSHSSMKQHFSTNYYLQIITQPTNALIVCHLFLNHFFKTLSLLLLASLHEKQRTQMQDMLPQRIIYSFRITVSKT